MTTHKSDVWSACATMMNVLIGKAENKEALEQVVHGLHLYLHDMCIYYIHRLVNL